MNNVHELSIKNNKRYSITAFVTIVLIIALAIILDVAMAYILMQIYDISIGQVFFVVPILVIGLYLFIAGLVVLGLFARFQQQAEEAKEDLESSYNEILALNEASKASNELIKKQYDMLHSMSDIYYSVHLINLEDNTVSTFKKLDFVESLISKGLGAREIMTEVMKATIVPSSRQAAIEFTDLETIATRMKGKKTISKEFLGLNIGWIAASFISVEEDAAGYPTQIVFTTKWINEEKKKEEQLVHISYTDELTGIYNRRAYGDAIRHYETTPVNAGFTYISMDIHGLKHINDTLGYSAGDEAIAGAAECMIHCLAHYGRLYRIDGNEFVALLTLNDIEADTLVATLENEISNWKGEKVDKLSLAIGIATVKEGEQVSFKEIQLLADQHMRDAKELLILKEKTIGTPENEEK